MIDLTPDTKFRRIKRKAAKPGPWIALLVAFEILYHFALPYFLT